MGFADALAEHEAPPDKGPPCSVSQVLAALDDTDRADVEAAILSAVTSTAIERALLAMYERREIAVRIGTGAVQRHRRHACKCFKS